VACLDEFKELAAVGEVDGGTSQLLVERCIVQQIEVLQQEQPSWLVVRMERKERAEIVERLLVEPFGVLDECGEFHIFLTI
jgi:hypothetical protein